MVLLVHSYLACCTINHSELFCCITVASVVTRLVCNTIIPSSVLGLINYCVCVFMLIFVSIATSLTICAPNYSIL